MADTLYSVLLKDNNLESMVGQVSEALTPPEDTAAIFLLTGIMAGRCYRP